MLKILVNVAEIMNEVATTLFSGNNTVEENNDTIEERTRRYWEGLSYQEQEEYFTNNEYLKDYRKNDFYERDRYMTAKHVGEISRKINREFTNKYDRY